LREEMLVFTLLLLAVRSFKPGSCAVQPEQAPFATDLIERLSNATGPSPLPKRINSEGIRLIFVAGLEGTGHHAWNAVFEQCVSSGECAVATNLTQALMQFDPVKKVVHGLFGADDAHVNSIQLYDVYQQMQSLAALSDSRAYLVGLCFVHRAAMLSYPNYNGVNKALDHPDLHILATLAEMAGVDFRVIVLQRSAREILSSTTSRDIGGSNEPKILIDNAAAIYTQMLLVDPAFYHCVQYRELGSLSQRQKHSLAAFIHPALSVPTIDRMLSAVRYAGSTQANLTSTAAPAAPTRLESKLLRHRSRLAKEAEGKSALQLAAEESSVRYHEWALELRLGLIDGLCSQTRPV
jgi:hypothetical protein